MNFSDFIVTLNNQAVYLMQDNRNEDAMELMEYVYRITGLTINLPRFDVRIEDYCGIIITHISCLMNLNRLFEIEKDFRKFERFSNRGRIPMNLSFKIHEQKSEYYIRRGFYSKAMDEVKLMDRFAHIDTYRYRMLIQKAKIDNVNKNVFSPFSINCVSEALAIAERMNEPYAIALAYNELAAMFSIHYPSLSFAFAKKAELTFARNGMKRETYEQRVPIANALIVNYLKDPQHNQNFREDAKKQLAKVDRSKLCQEQHKADYDYVYGMAYDDIKSLESAAKFYKSVGSYSSYCQMMDRIILLRLQNKDYIQAKNDISSYLSSAKKTHEKDYLSVMTHFKVLQNYIDEQLLGTKTK